MDNSWISYPIGAFTSAAQYMIGRGLIYILVLCLGSAIGCFTGSWSILEFIIGFLAMPLIALTSIFRSYGLVVIPMIGLCMVYYLKGNFPYKLLILPMLLMWLVAHDMTSWEYDEERSRTRSEKMEREMAEIIESAVDENM